MKILVDVGMGGLGAAVALNKAAPEQVAAFTLAPDCRNPGDAHAALCAALKRPVHLGAMRPTLRDVMPAHTAPRSVSVPPASPLHGVEALLRAAEGGGLTVLCLGPMTNLALALMKEPALAGRIARVIGAAGAQLGYGDATPCAEYNIYCDPEAADTVVKSGVPLTLVPKEAAADYYMAAAALALDGAVAKESYDAFLDIDVSGSGSYGQVVIDPIGRNPINGEVHGGEKQRVVSAVDEELVARIFASKG